MSAAPRLHLLPELPLFVGGKEHGNQLVTALSDLASNIFEAHVVAEFSQSVLPRERVQIDGIDQSAVHIEDCGFRHSSASVIMDVAKGQHQHEQSKKQRADENGRD